MVHKCNIFEKQESQWLNMVVDKDLRVISVIVFSKDMISNCLLCPHMKEGCESTAEFVRFLDQNEDLIHESK